MGVGAESRKLWRQRSLGRNCTWGGLRDINDGYFSTESIKGFVLCF